MRFSLFAIIFTCNVGWAQIVEDSFKCENDYYAGQYSDQFGYAYCGSSPHHNGLTRFAYRYSRNTYDQDSPDYKILYFDISKRTNDGWSTKSYGFPIGKLDELNPMGREWRYNSEVRLSSDAKKIIITELYTPHSIGKSANLESMTSNKAVVPVSDLMDGNINFIIPSEKIPNSGVRSYRSKVNPDFTAYLVFWEHVHNYTTSQIFNIDTDEPGETTFDMQRFIGGSQFFSTNFHYSSFFYVSENKIYDELTDEEDGYDKNKLLKEGYLEFGNLVSSVRHKVFFKDILFIGNSEKKDLFRDHEIRFSFEKSIFSSDTTYSYFSRDGFFLEYDSITGNLLHKVKIQDDFYQVLKKVLARSNNLSFDHINWDIDMNLKRASFSYRDLNSEIFNSWSVDLSSGQATLLSTSFGFIEADEKIERVLFSYDQKYAAVVAFIPENFPRFEQTVYLVATEDNQILMEESYRDQSIDLPKVLFNGYNDVIYLNCMSGVFCTVQRIVRLQ